MHVNSTLTVVKGMLMETIFDVVIRRDAKVTLHRFINYFKGFEKVGAVRELFGDKTEEVLNNLKVEFGSRGYMGVSDEDGHLIINASYLRDGDKRLQKEFTQEFLQSNSKILQTN